MRARRSWVWILLTVAATVASAAPARTAASKTVVSLGSRPPQHFPAGKVWSVVVTIWKRPVTCEEPNAPISYPLVDLKPYVILRSESGEQRRFVGRPTGVLGDYRANVVFPSAGTWSYAVDDRHGRVWPFGSAAISPMGPEPPAPDPRLRGSHPPLHLLPGARLLARARHPAASATLHAAFSFTFELWRLGTCRRPRLQVEYPVLKGRYRVRFHNRRTGRTVVAATRRAEREGSYTVSVRLPDHGLWDYAFLQDGRTQRLGAVRV
jgi:hypothetical protein